MKNRRQFVGSAKTLPRKSRQVFFLGLSRIAILYVGLFVLGFHPVKAASSTLTWTGGHAGNANDWNEKVNWTPNSANGGPTTSDDLIFSTPRTPTQPPNTPESG